MSEILKDIFDEVHRYMFEDNVSILNGYVIVFGHCTCSDRPNLIIFKLENNGFSYVFDYEGNFVFFRDYPKEIWKIIKKWFKTHKVTYDVTYPFYPEKFQFWEYETGLSIKNPYWYVEW